MHCCYIYADPRLPDEPLYVGMGTIDRAHQHKQYGSHNKGFQQALADLGSHGLEPVIQIIEAPSAEAAAAYERFWIKVYGRRDRGTGSLFNRTDGGQTGSHGARSAATLEKMSRSLTGKRKTAEARSRISRTMTGRTRSEETKHRIREGMLRKQASKALINVLPPS